MRVVVGRDRMFAKQKSTSIKASNTKKYQYTQSSLNVFNLSKLRHTFFIHDVPTIRLLNRDEIYISCKLHSHN